MLIQKMLSDKFFDIIGKHNNPVWAREELEWLVYDKHIHEYHRLDDFHRKEVDDFFDALRKLYGGN